jgi:hypothetical protein
LCLSHHLLKPFKQSFGFQEKHAVAPLHRNQMGLPWEVKQGSRPREYLQSAAPLSQDSLFSISDAGFFKGQHFIKDTNRTFNDAHCQRTAGAFSQSHPQVENGFCPDIF